MRLKVLDNNQLKKASVALIIIRDFMGESLHRSFDALVHQFIGTSINR